MAEVQPPGYLQNAGAVNTAHLLRHAIQSSFAGATSNASLRVRGGVHPSLGSRFLVQQAGSPNMTVDVNQGVALVPGSEANDQAAYVCLSNTIKNIAITASNPTNPRIDIIVIKVQDSFYSGATDSWSTVVVTGTAAASPSAPAAPANSITIAQIAVGAGVTSIVNANITDTRTYSAGVGGLVTVANQTERDALADLYDGYPVWRRDTKNIEVYNGSAFVTFSAKGSAGASAQATTSGSDSTTSASYVNMAGTGSVTSFSFTKRNSATKVRLGMSAGWTNATATTLQRFGLQLNAVDYDCFQSILGVGGFTTASGFVLVGAGVVGAGTYTVQARWKRQGGTGTGSRGTNEWLAIEALEVD